MPPDTGPPPHVHHAEDETFVLLEGRLSFRLGEEVHEATPGTAIFVPRGTVHSFANGLGGAARMLFMCSPAGMEGMFAEIGTPGTRGVVAPPRSAADVAALVGVAARYRFSIMDP